VARANTAVSTAAEVRAGRLSALQVVRASLDAIEKDNGRLNAFYEVFADEALAGARRIDRIVADGGDPGCLAGVPFAAKSLFDVAGHVTIAGSAARRSAPPASADAFAVRKLREAGAILVGTTQMDELACGATGENPHFGAVRNPWDMERMTGGSSGGSAASVAAGLVPISLGSDTNGSIRAPAALCGVWGIKPSFGRLSRSGCLPYADSLDCVGGFAADVDDLELLYQCLQGRDDADARQLSPSCYPEVVMTPGSSLRVGILGGFFESYASEACWQAARAVGELIGPCRLIDVPDDDMQHARSAATILSNVEVAAAQGALLKLADEALSARLRTRLLAGALCPQDWYRAALAFQQAFRARVMRWFDTFDILVAPCTPFAAPRFDEDPVMVKGRELQVASHLGMLTQPVSFAGLPVVVVPVCATGSLPVGVQLIGPAWGESICLSAGRMVAEGLATSLQ
jgi:AtzE family amidohydrolase